MVCSNRVSLQNTQEIEEVLVHELVHAYDVKVQKLNLKLCETLAYSEVRAAAQAECHNSWLPSSYCVQNKATAATGNLFPMFQARKCVNAVYGTAVNDTRPFPSDARRPFTDQTPSEK